MEKNLFNGVIIKTRLTLSHTSTFSNLDCGCWDAEREAKIRQQRGEQPGNP